MSFPQRIPVIAPFLALCIVASIAGAQSQSTEVEIAVPGIGQDQAQGLYLFKFAITDKAGTTTYWSHDGTSREGREPQSAMPLQVSFGRTFAALGEPPLSGAPELTRDLLSRDDVVLKIWVSNGKDPRFFRLKDRRLRGKGYAYAAEKSRDSDRLQGKAASDFELAGAVWRHEENYDHKAVSAGRRYHASSEIGSGRDLSVHFDVAEGAHAELTLHASRSAAPPSITDLHMKSARAENQATGTVLDVVDYEGAGWLAGARETYDYCNNCFKRMLPPATKIFLDGIAFEAWKTSSDEGPSATTIGRVDNLTLLGLVRFERSLRVVSEHRGVDNASGTTTVWYYTARRNGGVPGALQVLLDGGDVTPALVATMDESPSVSPAGRRTVASRFDGAVPSADDLDPNDFLGRPADAVWLREGASIKARARVGGSTIMLVGEVLLESGPRSLRLEGSAPAVLELGLEDGFERVVALQAAGVAEAGIAIGESGWHQFRLIVAQDRGTIEALWEVDGAEPRVRTVPLLGGGGDDEWSAGPLDFEAAGIALAPGPHVLTFRNRSERNGHLEYSLAVD